MKYEYRPATLADLECIWEKNIRQHPGDDRWVRWKEEYIGYNRTGQALTWVVVCDGEPVGEGTLLFAPECSAIAGRTVLADGATVASVNALRIEKLHEGQGHISAMVRLMEAEAARRGFQRLSIGVEKKEKRNQAIYHHWHYDRLIMTEVEDGELVYFFEKGITALR